MTLNCSKLSILANGEDAATISVYHNGLQEDITSKAEIYAGDKLLSSSEFTTSTPGKYTIKALYEGLTSNTVEITAVSGESAEGISLKASKPAVYPDGGDFAVLTLATKEGGDVTEQGEFFADGKKLESNRFSTTTASLTPVKITAKFNGINVEGSVQITASKIYDFQSRMLLEDITRTRCQYCPLVIKVIEELRKDSQPVVVPISVHNTESDIYKIRYSADTKAFADAFCKFYEQSLTEAPKVFINREKKTQDPDHLDANELRKQALAGPKDVAIALESKLEQKTLSVKATIGSKKSFSGKVVAVLAENGIIADQQGMGKIEMYRMMRGFAPSIEGKAVSITQDKPTSFEATFDLTKTTVENPKNCEVIVFVTDDADGLCKNVQYASVGEVKGY